MSQDPLDLRISTGKALEIGQVGRIGGADPLGQMERDGQPKVIGDLDLRFGQEVDDAALGGILSEETVWLESECAEFPDLALDRLGRSIRCDDDADARVRI